MPEEVVNNLLLWFWSFSFIKTDQRSLHLESSFCPDIYGNRSSAETRSWARQILPPKSKDKIVKNQKTKNHKMKDQKTEQKKFSKVKVLKMVGLLTKEFNYDTLEFEDSRKLTIVCFVNLFLRVTYAIKHTLFYLFPREATAQLFIGIYDLYHLWWFTLIYINDKLGLKMKIFPLEGSLFNYLHPNGRMFMAIVVRALKEPIHWNSKDWNYPTLIG